MTASDRVLYRVQPADPAGHLFRVEMHIPDPDPAGQIVAMPAWIPGSYMIRDFARHVGQFQALAGDESLHVEKLDKQCWEIEPCTGPLVIRYHVYAWDLSVRAAHLDRRHGYFNGTSLFMARQEGIDEPLIEEPVHLDILPPAAPVDGNWAVHTAMSAVDVDDKGFGRYACVDFEDLVDHPVEMGDHTVGHFDACGVPHEIVLAGRNNADMDRLCRDLKVICEHHIRFFGEPAPMARYVFLVMVVGDGYGGLEHRASTSLLCSRKDLPAPGMGEADEAYRQFLGLCSHEYFHTWNVKRIRPAAFIPVDLSREVHTELMWVFEGFTSYYDDLALVRSGLVSPEQYLETLGQTITRVWRTSGRHKQSVAESSFDTWTRFYKQDENAPNAIVSYYTKGALLALALDLTLRIESAGKHSLDDVMSRLWSRWLDGCEGVEEHEMESIIEAVTGVDPRPLLDACLHGTDDPPLVLLLEAMGVQLKFRPATSSADRGGKPCEGPAKPLLGARVVDDHGEAKLATVFEGGAAHVAGLSANDLVMAVDGLRVTGTNLEARIGALAAGQIVPVHAFRGDELIVTELQAVEPPADTAWLVVDDQAGDSRTARRTAWLGLA